MTMKSQLAGMILMSEMLGDTVLTPVKTSKKNKRQVDNVTIPGHERRKRKKRENMKKQSRKINRQR